MPLRDPPKRGRGRPRAAAPQSRATTIQALDRGAMLLRALADDGRATLSELALRLDMPASTAHRILATLQVHRLVDFSAATQEWRIGVEAFRIGSAFSRDDKLLEIGREVMHALVEQCGETANLAIADDGEVVFLSQVDTPHPIRAFFSAGTRAPMHSSGIGKALLAEMGRREVERILQRRGLSGFTPNTLTSEQALFADLRVTRQRGWSLDDEERHTGMRCIAAPVFNQWGEAVAGLSVSGPTQRLGDAVLDAVAAAVCAAARELTLRSGGKPRDGS